MISSDMEEVIGVSDRVAVMHEGSVSGVLEREQFGEYNVLRLAMGQVLEITEALRHDEIRTRPVSASGGGLRHHGRDQSGLPIIGELAEPGQSDMPFGVFALGEGLVIITGGIDLSLGSMFALLGVVFVDLLTTYQIYWPFALLLVLLGGLALGGIQGFLITRLKMHPFIVTFVRVADLSRRRALLHERFDTRLRLR